MSSSPVEVVPIVFENLILSLPLAELPWIRRVTLIVVLLSPVKVIVKRPFFILLGVFSETA